MAADPAAPPKVSVILPVYGVEKYIEECLVSIQRQNLREIEIIPVNDKSPDGSQAIIDRLAAEDPRIRPIVLPENVGQGFARNEGIRAARGEYIYFIDPDDLLASDEVLAECLNAAEADGSDLVRVRKVIFDDGKPPSTGRLDANEAYFPKREVIANASNDPHILKSWHHCILLYRKSLIDDAGLTFITPQWEERAFVCSAYKMANQITALPILGNAIRKRAKSTSRRKRTLTDLSYMASNIRATAEVLANTPSLIPAGLQFASSMVTGIWTKTLLEAAKTDGAKKVMKEIKQAFDLYGITIESAASLPQHFISSNQATGQIFLFLAALHARKWEWVEIALLLDKVPQARLFEELLTGPADETAAAFQAALSLYARNDLVKTDKHKSYDGPKPRIVVHIGTTKTGSTFIQHFFEKNRAALLREGVWYPEVGLFWQEDRPHKQAGHARFTSEAVAGRCELKDQIEAGLRLANGRIHTIILSSEAYYLNRNSVEISHHFAGYPVEMIGYFRPQDDWANSQYAEFVAGGAVGRVSVPIAEWLRTDDTRLRLDYFSYLEHWAGAIGRENVQARIYDRRGFDGRDVVTDFMTQIDLSHLSVLPRPAVGQSNEFPFNSAHVRLIRNFNAMEWPDDGSYLRFIDDVARRISEHNRRTGAATPRVNMLTMREREEIMEMVAASNRELAKVYFGREDGTLFDCPAAFSEEKEQGISQEEIDIIFACYERHKPEVVRAGEATNGATTKTIETLSYKAFSRIAGPFLTPAKKRKLDHQPDRFFTDSKSRAMRLVWWCVRKEKGL
jgi:capsular polysaccharide export protein